MGTVQVTEFTETHSCKYFHNESLVKKFRDFLSTERLEDVYSKIDTGSVEFKSKLLTGKKEWDQQMRPPTKTCPNILINKIGIKN